METYIKVVAYRDFLKDGKTLTAQELFEKPYNFESHQALFNDVETFLTANIPQSERYNLHYTLHHLPHGAVDKKQVAKIEVIPLDIDHTDYDKIDEYLRAVEQVFRVTRDTFVSIATGNGLQFLFLLDKPLTEDKFNALRASYRLKAEQLEEYMIEKDLIKDFGENKTHVDLQAFRIGTFRLPSTLNKKEGKESRPCEMITRELSPISLEHLGLYFEAIPKKTDRVDRVYAGVHSEYVMENCAALKDFKERKGNVSYSHWFAATSIVSRFTDVDGPRLVHDLSKGHPNYSEDETQNLIDNTLKSGGPVGCARFSESFEGCKDCKYFKTKLKSPINLRDKEFLPHEHTGFHKQVFNAKGEPTGWKPVYKEIVSKFKQEYEHVSMQTSEDVFVYSKEQNKWRIMPQREMLSIIRQYTDKKPGDYPRTSVFTETVNHIELENIVIDDDFFEASMGKVNFNNGHVEIEGNNLNFYPTSIDSLKHRFLFALPYDYDPEAKAPRFEQFIKEICGDDEEKAQSLCEYIGYVISNDEYWAHKFMVLEGDGSNGKSVLLDIIRGLCGEGNYASLKVTDLANDQQRFNLIGKMANICDENEKGSLTKSADVKNLTAGGIFTFKQVYSKPGEARNRAKFIFSTNHGFSTTDSTGGMMRRYFPIPLDQVFTEENNLKGPHQKVADPKITEKLLAELSGIWNHCIKQYLKAKDRKRFTVSKETKSKLDEFSSMSNPLKTYVGSFVHGIESEPIYKDPETADKEFKSAPHMTEVKDTEYIKNYVRVPVNEMRKDFTLWLQNKGRKAEYGEQQFSRMLGAVMRDYVTNPKVRDKVYKRVRVSGELSPHILCKWKPFNS